MFFTTEVLGADGNLLISAKLYHKFMKHYNYSKKDQLDSLAKLVSLANGVMQASNNETVLLELGGKQIDVRRLLNLTIVNKLFWIEYSRIYIGYTNNEN